ncbi:MAG: hypothetical protein EOO13_17965, partial [Chitinophagaceae bacterium]
EQANKVLDTVKDFVKEKFPMMAGAVDNLLGTDDVAASTAPSVTTPTENSGFMDKISDFIPGETGQKVEDFAKGAAGKIGGFFDGDKK